jgi:acyl-CoA synthetase (AMP-forming)/AMP-acid ligase II
MTTISPAFTVSPGWTSHWTMRACRGERNSDMAAFCTTPPQRGVMAATERAARPARQSGDNPARRQNASCPPFIHAMTNNPLPPFRAIADMLREHARARPGAPALRQGARTLSWGELDALMERVAAALQRDGVQPTQSIALCGSNSLAYAVLFLGALRAGVAVAPLQVGALPQQLAGMVADAGAKLLFADKGLDIPASGVRRLDLDTVDTATSWQGWLAPEGKQPQPVDTQPQWPFNIIYSSGTTGTPKGIVQAHAMRWAHVARAAAGGYGPDSVALIATSLCSNTTLVCVFPALSVGGCVVLSEGRFDPSAYLALAQRVRATHAMLVPVQYQRLMALPDFDRYDLSSFVMKFCTSAPFLRPLKADVLARWPGLRPAAPRCRPGRGVDGQRLLGAEAVQVVRATGLGAGAAQAFAAKRLHAHHRADHVAVDVHVAHMGACRQRLGAAVDAGLDAQRQAKAQRVDLVDHGLRVALPAHDVQHRAEDLGLQVGDAIQLRKPGAL